MLKALCPWLVALSYWLSASAQAEARLAIIIDDIGYNQAQSERAARLNGKFTLSVLPFTPYGFSSAQLAHSHGKELMLHLPMSAINHQPLGRGGLVSGMQKAAFLEVIRQDLASIPHIKGVNNHMGSRLTQEAEPMQWLMSELRTRDLYFVDSRTSAQTKAFDIAKQYQLPALKRDVFLDDINEPKAIEYQLNRAIQLAKSRGSAVAIGHPYPATLQVLSDVIQRIGQEGVTLVPVSHLLPAASSMRATNKEIKQLPATLNTLENCVAPSFLLTESQTNVDFSAIGDMMPKTQTGY
jgi:uncharacterized protein